MTSINELIEQLLPPKARLVVYLIVDLVALIFGAWQIAEGNWVEALFGVLVALQTSLSASKTPIAPKEYESW
jgi:TRAP-type C4-dicarboxylate transport system permease small subunit